ncbi:nuclear transport factor 2 family protein [Archangium violaceum]|uniref:nuclear transport factor 2 family protein n=1 Tax=Archangium violaceum TaxID=83451 RepID=UPI001950AAF3|nr:nuclear transport factor 2 family protein [Archangium violaceum]QRN98754.1 nuclear transport factor 2 family protein [Archangium violaceum]
MMNRRTLLAAGLAMAAMGLVACERPVERTDVVHWIEAYGKAWETKDADAAVQLFTENAIYEAIPGVNDQTFVGRSAIHTYWENITAGQSDVMVQHGEPLMEGNRATVELWVTMRVPALNPEGEHWVTLIETNVLYFDTADQVSRNVEYWNLIMGKVSPPAGWGAD